MSWFGKVVGAVVGTVVGGPIGAVVGAVYGDEVKAGVVKIGEYTLAGGGSLVGLAAAGAALVLAGPGIAITVYVAATSVGNMVIRQRKLSNEERAFVSCVFGSTLPFDNIILTNLTGAQNRFFTLPNVAGQIIVNIGGAYEHPTAYTNEVYKIPGQVLIHELTHAWQIQKATFKAGYVCEGVSEQTQNMFHDVYQAKAGKPWGSYNNEQQAFLIDHWFAQGRNRSDALYPYVKILNGGGEPPNCNLSWGPWQSIGGKLKGRPGAVTIGDSIVDIYGRGLDDHLWQKSWVNGKWVDWHLLDGNGKLASAPTVISMNAQHRDVYVRGTDGAVYHKWWTAKDGWYSGWENIGGTGDTEVGVVAVEGGIVDVYICGKEGYLWQNTWVQNHWTGWHCLDNTMTILGGPSVISFNGKHRDVYARGSNGGLWHKYWTAAAGWSKWEVVQAQQIASQPGVIALPGGQVDIYIKSPQDNGLWQQSWVGDWFGWHVLDVNMAIGSGPSACSLNPKHRDIYMTAADGTVFHKVWS